jgi:hypothetical protein
MVNGIQTSKTIHSGEIGDTQPRNGEMTTMKWGYRPCNNVSGLHIQVLLV